MYEIKKAAQRDEFERVSFVLKARANSALRPFMTVVHAERTKTGTLLVASDGKRLHLTEIGVKLPEGDYKPDVAKDAITFLEPVTGIDYPDWKSLIPKTLTEQGIIDLADTGMSKNQSQTAGMTLAFKRFIDTTGALVNLRFLDDLLKTEWVIYAKTKRGAIILKPKSAAKKTVAVIMPMGDPKAA